jgi:hypothetical protein
MVEFILFFILAVWLGVLSFYFWRLKRNYNLFTEGSDKKTVESVLHGILKEQQVVKKDIAHLVLRCDTIEKNEVFHIQKIGLLRFNPFKDTGGDQSFVLTLGDARNSGVVITVLHSRSGVRWYVKRVKEGRGVENELSDEEKMALKQATGVRV